VTLTFDLLTPKLNGFPGLTVEHFYVKFGDPRLAASVFEILCRKTDRDRQTNAGEKPTPATTVRVGKFQYSMSMYNCRTSISRLCLKRVRRYFTAIIYRLKRKWWRWGKLTTVVNRAWKFLCRSKAVYIAAPSQSYNWSYTTVHNQLPCATNTDNRYHAKRLLPNENTISPIAEHLVVVFNEDVAHRLVKDTPWPMHFVF